MNQKEVIYRRVEDGDYEGIIKLILEFYDESIEEYGSTLDFDFMILMFGKLKDTSFLVEEDGVVIGLLAGQIVTDSLSEEKTYAEVMWFMTKEKRRYGPRLLSFVESWARARGMRKMIMVHFFNQQADKIAALYKRMGYRPMEIHYIKEL